MYVRIRCIFQVFLNNTTLAALTLFHTRFHLLWILHCHVLPIDALRLFLQAASVAAATTWLASTSSIATLTPLEWPWHILVSAEESIWIPFGSLNMFERRY